MEAITIWVPEAYRDAMTDLRKIPFAKTKDGYRFASWIYDLNRDEASRQELLEAPHGDEVTKLVDDAKKQLDEVFITEDDYLAWSVHKKEKGGIKTYHEILYGLSNSLLLLSIDVDVKSIQTEAHASENSLYKINWKTNNGTSRRILNKNNPFSDVTIKSQMYFYKTEDGSTETLFFDTNNIVEKVDKNDKNLFTMRPGFSVTKEHGVTRRPTQKVTFANSIAEPIVDDEEHIYIHID